MNLSRSASRPLRDAPLRWVLLAVIAGGAAIGLFGPTLFNDGDTLWHLRAGEWMLTQGAVLARDPFTSTMAGQPWTTHEWLAEVVTALAWRAMGATGVAALHAIAAAVALAVMARALSRVAHARTAVLTMTIALACLMPGYLARPHVLMWPLLALWSAGLVDARADQRAPSWWLWIVMLLWSNMHGSWALGIALLLGFLGEALLDDVTRWRTTLASWGAFTIGALLAAAVTPHGVRGLVFPLELLQIKELARIREWAPLSWTTLQPAHLALLGVLVSALHPRVRPTWTRLVLLGALCVLTVRHERHQMLLSIVGCIVLADAWRPRRALSAHSHSPDGPTPWPSWPLVTGCLGALVLLRMASGPRELPDRPAHARAAIAAMPVEMRRAAGLNDYAFGGALIHAGVRPFVDGRADLFGDAFLRRYDAIMAGDAAALDSAVARYDLQWALVPRDAAVVTPLRARGWQSVSDRDGVLLLLRTRAAR